MRRLLIRRANLIFLTGVVTCIAAVFLLQAGMRHTSTDRYCASCHVHPQATASWKNGPHVKTGSGVIANCVDCHLPPDGARHYVEKFKAGARDLYGYYLTDVSQIDWDELSSYDNALHFTFDEACASCHVEMFPEGIADKAVDAHLHYNKNRDTLRCINCHLKVGHYHDEPDTDLTAPLASTEPAHRQTAPTLDALPAGAFQDYTEIVPNLDVSFEMVAVPGGSFLMGSPESEAARRPDEGPRRNVQISPFWMGRIEVTWDEYLAFYSQTATRGKNEKGEKSDAITGPTPPYGSPDQGWGRGTRPAITMTHYAATKYCEWLSSVTGRHYRLPTEAEWEYACRGGSTGSYFLSTSEEPSFLESLFGPSGPGETEMAKYAWYAANGRSRTHPAYTKEPNPFGLLHMIGNVREFCLDWYDPGAYGLSGAETVTDPPGPAQGQEHVVRGGSFKSTLHQLRSAARDHTRHDGWLKTDPQTPKSVWWYSDAVDVGFRVVREYRASATTAKQN